MSLPDLVNATFEFGGSLAIMASIVKLARDKQVRGYSWYTLAFFTSWGMWNLFYYPSLGQWWSFAAGISVFLTNIVYLSMLIYYSRRTA